MFNTSRIKILFIAVALAFAGTVLFYSQGIVGELREDSESSLIFYTELYAKLASDPLFQDYNFFFEQIIPRISFPIIITVPKTNEINAWKNIPGVPDTADRSERVEKELQKLAVKMDESTPPIPLTIDGLTVGMIHHSDSLTITKLRWLPFIEIIGALVIILAGFLGFQYIRRNEKQYIWVGLAKETAHQLGTPISSLMGWLEIAKLKLGEESEIVTEMDMDIKRLEKVSNRFSQIGAKLKQSEIQVSDLVGDVQSYMEHRIPKTNNKITLSFSIKDAGAIYANYELLEWALENLIKNSVDALEGKEGTVTVVVFKRNDQVIFDIKDSGRGIPDAQWKTIFKPGYSTKKRGWGMGLSLTRRIVEDYHHGNIFVKESKPWEKTILRIVLKGCCNIK